MNLDVFRYILINNDTGVTKTLEASPADWQDTTHRHFRSVRYGSVLREDTLSLRFVLTGGAFDLGGYYFLEDAYESKGVYADVTCKRQRLNPFTNAYEERFVGKVDYSDSSGWSFGEEWVEFKLIDSGKLAKFIARDEINVDVFSTTSIDGVAITPFNNPYREITAPKVDVYLEVEANGTFSGTRDFNHNEYGEWNLNGDTTINEVGESITIEAPGQATIYTNTREDSVQIDYIQLTGTNTIQTAILNGGVDTYQAVLDYRFEVYYSGGGFWYAREYTADVVSGTAPIFSIGDPFSGISVPAITVPAGGRIDFKLRLTVNLVSGNGFQVRAVASSNDDVLTNFSFYEKTNGWPDNQIRGLFAHEMAARFIQLYTSETDTNRLLQSPILGTPNSEFQNYPSVGYFGNEFVFNGFQARQFVDRAINGNFNDFFKSLTTDRLIGLWYNKKSDYFEIKSIESYYKLSQFPIHLGEVTNFKRYPAKDYYFSGIKTGYPKTENEDYQGVNEFNTETEHNTKTETKTNKDFRSRWRRATVDIELLRRKNISKYASEDTKNDDNNYIVSTNGTSILQGQLSNASGIININQYYNLLKTPRQNLKRQMLLFGTTLYKIVSKLVQFGKSAKGTNISYTDPSTGLNVSEFDDITNSEFVEPLVLPEILEFDGLYTNEIEEEIAIDPHRYFVLTALGREWYGYIDPEVVGTPYNQTATYKLIRLNENRI